MEIKSNMIVYISLLCREGSPKEAQLGTMLGNGSTVGFDQGAGGAEGKRMVLLMVLTQSQAFVVHGDTGPPAV